MFRYENDNNNNNNKQKPHLKKWFLTNPSFFGWKETKHSIGNNDRSFYNCSSAEFCFSISMEYKIHLFLYGERLSFPTDGHGAGGKGPSICIEYQVIAWTPSGATPNACLS